MTQLLLSGGELIVLRRSRWRAATAAAAAATVAAAAIRVQSDGLLIAVGATEHDPIQTAVRLAAGEG